MNRKAPKYRIIDRRKFPRPEDGSVASSIESRPFEVQLLDGGQFYTIPGAWYATKKEAQESLKGEP